MIQGIIIVLVAIGISSVITAFQLAKAKKRREAMKEKDNRIIAGNLFAYNSATETIYMFKPELQIEAFQRFQEKNGIMADDVVRILSEDSEDALSCRVRDVCRILNIVPEMGELAFKPINRGSKSATRKEYTDLLIDLGYDVKFDEIGDKGRGIYRVGK